MSKYIGYVILLSGMVLLFNLFGLSTGETGFLQFLNNPETYTGTNFYQALIVMIGIFTATGAVSLFVSGSFKIDFIAIAPMILLLLSLLAELLSIFSTVADGSHVVAILVFSPMFLLWIFTTVEWWRGVNY